MKLMSYSSMVLMGALCLTFSTASASEDQKSPAKGTKSSAAGKSTVAVAPRVPDQVVYVKVTGSLIPQRYIVRDGRILTTGTNTQILLTSELATVPAQQVSGILVNNIPDITFRGVR